MDTNVILYTVLQNKYKYFSLPLALYYKCITFRKNSNIKRTAHEKQGNRNYDR